MDIPADVTKAVNRIMNDPIRVTVEKVVLEVYMTGALAGSLDSSVRKAALDFFDDGEDEQKGD